jgi:hypothetical protein
MNDLNHKCASSPGQSPATCCENGATTRDVLCAICQVAICRVDVRAAPKRSLGVRHGRLSLLGQSRDSPAFDQTPIRVVPKPSLDAGPGIKALQRPDNRIRLYGVQCEVGHKRRSNYIVK